MYALLQLLNTVPEVGSSHLAETENYLAVFTLKLFCTPHLYPRHQADTHNRSRSPLPPTLHHSRCAPIHHSRCAIPALDLNPDDLECRATVNGLDPAKIYVFRVHTGNSFGFEATGSNLMFGSTISLPTVGVQDLSVASIQSSENRSNYKVTLTWSKPVGWPVGSKYYDKTPPWFKVPVRLNARTNNAHTAPTKFT